MTFPTSPPPFWIALAERYFEGLTTEAEEEALRQHLAQNLDHHPTLQAARAVMSLAAVARRKQAAATATHESRSAENAAPSAVVPAPSAENAAATELHGTASPHRLRLSWGSARALRRVAAVFLICLTGYAAWWSYDYLHPKNVAYVDGRRITDPVLVDLQMQQALRTALDAEDRAMGVDEQLRDMFLTLDADGAVP